MNDRDRDIVRRFVAGESIGDIFWRTRVSERDWEPIESALRAALIEKDAEIERLRGYLDTPKGTSP